MPSACARSCRAVGCASPVPLGPPTTATTSRSRRVRVLLDHPRGGVEQDVGRLERLDAPDEQQQDGVGRHPEAGAGGSRLAGAEVLEVDAGGDGDDALDVGAVEVDQLARLVGGVGDQPVGGLDDLLLADDAAQRLGGVAVGEREVLHLGQGVGGVHERDAPALGGQPADLAGQPVVRVHDVVEAGLVRGLGAQHAGGQRAQLGRAGPPWTAPRTGRR